MNDVRRHYDLLLGPVYSWILGDFGAAHAKYTSLFERLGLAPFDTGRAVDLGAGPGCQSIPLAERGYDVVAIDFCADLLAELQRRAGGLPVATVRGDIGEFRRHVDAADLVVCMGDTLVHLPDRGRAEALLVDMADALVPGGSAIVSIRDYVAPGPTGAGRFIPIRSSADRIFTCFLEYEAETVRVSDILQQRRDEGWSFEVSSYRKLRLGLDWVAAVLEAAGLGQVERIDAAGMPGLLARK